MKLIKDINKEIKEGNLSLLFSVYFATPLSIIVCFVFILTQPIFFKILGIIVLCLYSFLAGMIYDMYDMED